MNAIVLQIVLVMLGCKMACQAKAILSDFLNPSANVLFEGHAKKNIFSRLHSEDFYANSADEAVSPVWQINRYLRGALAGGSQ